MTSHLPSDESDPENEVGTTPLNYSGRTSPPPPPGGVGHSIHPLLHHISTCVPFGPLTNKPEDAIDSRSKDRKDTNTERQSRTLATMAFTGLISAIVLAMFALLRVEGTARGAVPLDTLTFDKVFLKMVVPLP